MEPAHIPACDCENLSKPGISTVEVNLLKIPEYCPFSFAHNETFFCHQYVLSSLDFQVLFSDQQRIVMPDALSQYSYSIASLSCCIPLSSYVPTRRALFCLTFQVEHLLCQYRNNIFSNHIQCAICKFRQWYGVLYIFSI